MVWNMDSRVPTGSTDLPVAVFGATPVFSSPFHGPSISSNNGKHRESIGQLLDHMDYMEDCLIFHGLTRRSSITVKKTLYWFLLQIVWYCIVLILHCYSSLRKGHKQRHTLKMSMTPKLVNQTFLLNENYNFLPEWMLWEMSLSTSWSMSGCHDIISGSSPTSRIQLVRLASPAGS